MPTFRCQNISTTKKDLNGYLSYAMFSLKVVQHTYVCTRELFDLDVKYLYMFQDFCRSHESFFFLFPNRILYSLE